MKLGIREFFIWKALIFGVLIVISTEIFSFFNIINSLSIKIFWILIIAAFIFIIFQLNKRNKFNFNLSKKISNLSGFEVIFIFAIFLLTFLNSLFYPPNTLDAMSYHMPKVMHWIQNSNVNFYPTNDLRQLILAPMSEFIILHLYLIVNGDYLANLVQWYSMIISCITVSLIAKEFGCNNKFQIFSVLFCATLPMGILQSSSTQTDYVTTMWLLMMVYFVLKYIYFGLPKYIFAFSFSLGLGILTKATFYLFAFPFCIWIGLSLITKKRKHFIYLFIIPLIILFLNFGHFNRNVSLYNNPLGISEESPIWTNEIINLKTLTSNIVRNSALNLALPNKRINHFTKTKIDKFHEYLNISSGDTRTTKSGGRGFYIPFSFYESTAPNSLHFLIIFLIIFFISYKKKLSGNTKYYFYSIIAGFVLFSLILKWVPQNNRLLLSLFVLISPIVSFTLYKLKLNKLTHILALLISIYSVPYILFNKSRPMAAEMKFEGGNIKFYKPFFLKEERNELYFIADRFYNKRNLYTNYSIIIEKIKKANCDKIEFDNSTNLNLEYPLWVLLKKNLNDLNPNIQHINVNNMSSTYIKGELNYNKCATIYSDEVKILK